MAVKIADKVENNATPFMRKHTIRKGAKRDNTLYATIAIIGKTGTGKSTISNAFLLGNYKKSQEIFKESSNVKSETKDCKASIGTLMNKGKSPL